MLHADHGNGPPGLLQIAFSPEKTKCCSIINMRKALVLGPFFSAFHPGELSRFCRWPRSGCPAAARRS